MQKRAFHPLLFVVLAACLVCSSSARAHGFFYSFMDTGVDEGQFLLDDTYAIEFSTGLFNTTAFSFTPGTTDVTINFAGTYVIRFYTRCFAEVSSFVVTLDDVPVAGGQFDDCNGEVVAQASAGDIIRIYNALNYEVAIYAFYEDSVYASLTVDRVDVP